MKNRRILVGGYIQFSRLRVRDRSRKNVHGPLFQRTASHRHASCRCLAIFARQRQDDAGSVRRRMAKSGLHRGWSCRSSNRPREIDHLALLLHHSPAPSSSAYRRPARFPPALPLLLPPPLLLPLPLLLPDSTIHPRARCIIVRPHRLAHTSSTCPEQASALAHSSLARTHAHTYAHLLLPTTHSPYSLHATLPPTTHPSF